MTPILIPQLDANIVDVTITQWHKQVGEAVKKGEILAVLTTDKAAYEFEAPVSGVLLTILAPAKSIVLTGSMIGAIGEPGEALGATLHAGLPATHGQPGVSPAGTGRDAAPAAQPRIRATPRARRMAAEKGFDLAVIQRRLGLEIIDEAAIAAYEHTTGDNR